MSITIIYRNQETKFEKTITVKEALREMKLSAETHLAIKNGELVTEDEILRDGDVVKLVAVISGGAD